jgi:hypothetical protein
MSSEKKHKSGKRKINFLNLRSGSLSLIPIIGKLDLKKKINNNGVNGG